MVHEFSNSFLRDSSPLAQLVTRHNNWLVKKQAELAFRPPVPPQSRRSVRLAGTVGKEDSGKFDSLGRSGFLVFVAYPVHEPAAEFANDKGDNDKVED